ncbi:MAG: DNA repair exonuclease [Candidatus Obscuribacterales bacterium]|nr:DNA repair exonuclease [Candidatus Obscuribacterales bacterium]
MDSPLRGLERYEGAPVEEIRLSTRRALENLVSLALDRKVAFVILAGDLFDGDWKDYNTGLFFAKQMSRLREAEIPVYIVKGNHDAASKMTRALKMPDNVHVFSHSKPETFYLESCSAALHGQSFSNAAVVKNLAEDYPKAENNRFNIGVLHTCATGRDGHGRYAPCTMDDLLAKGYDYWALGHVHKRETLKSEPLIVFPGNIQGRHIRETGAKGCVIVTVDDKNQATQSFEPICVLQWEHCIINLDAAFTQDDVISKVNESLSALVREHSSYPLAVRVELTGASSTDSLLRSNSEHVINQIRAIATDCASDQIWLEKVKINTSASVAQHDSNMQDGPLGELLSLIDEYKTDLELQKSLRDQLAEIDKKLSLEVKDLIGWNEDLFLRETLEDVQNILFARLAHKE